MEKVARDLFRKFWHFLPLGNFVVAILCLCFAYGVVVDKWYLFPYRFLNIGWDSLKELRNRKPEFLHPARYNGQGIVVYEPEQTFPGVTQ